jgi:hypothetical protein
MQQNDHLKEFVNGSGTQTNQPANNENVQYHGNGYTKKVDHIEATSTWIEIPLKDLPCGRYYKDGTRISIRPAKTKELESFSVVNEKNPYDVLLKLNEILSACVKFVHADGTPGSFRDLKDGDRDTIAIVLSRASAKQGRRLERKATCACSTDKEEFGIDMIPANYVVAEPDESILPYFDQDSSAFVCPMYNGEIVKLAPPTIGITQDVNNYIFYVTTKSQGKTTPNVSFMQCIPYVLAGRGITSMTVEQLEQEEYNFSKLNDELFMFIDDAVNLINVGVDAVKGRCPKCAQEVRTSFGFPNGPRALFIVPNAFKQFVRQPV